MLQASLFRFCPRLMEIGTEEPTPIRSDSAKLMMTKGIARLTAAKAVEPKKLPDEDPVEQPIQGRCQHTDRAGDRGDEEELHRPRLGKQFFGFHVRFTFLSFLSICIFPLPAG